MTFDDYKELYDEIRQTYPAHPEDLDTEGYAEIGWVTFGRILSKKGLKIVKNDILEVGFENE